MQTADYVCKCAKMWFWSVSASFKQAQSHPAEPDSYDAKIAKICNKKSGHFGL